MATIRLKRTPQGGYTAADGRYVIFRAQDARSWRITDTHRKSLRHRGDREIVKSTTRADLAAVRTAVREALEREEGDAPPAQVTAVVTGGRL